MAHKHYIDLGRKHMIGEVSTSSEKNKTYYPSVYVDKDLGLGEKDVGKEMMALVKIKVKSVEKRMSEKKKTDTVSFDILGINLKPGKVSHYGKE